MTRLSSSSPSPISFCISSASCRSLSAWKVNCNQITTHICVEKCSGVCCFNANTFLTLFLRARFFLSVSCVNAGNSVTSPPWMAAWMMPRSLGSSSWEQHIAESVMASMFPSCCTYSWITSFLSSSEPLYFFSNSRMSCTVIWENNKESESSTITSMQKLKKIVENKKWFETTKPTYLYKHNTETKLHGLTVTSITIK